MSNRVVIVTRLSRSPAIGDGERKDTRHSVILSASALRAPALAPRRPHTPAWPHASMGPCWQEVPMGGPGLGPSWTVPGPGPCAHVCRGKSSGPSL